MTRKQYSLTDTDGARLYAAAAAAGVRQHRGLMLQRLGGCASRSATLMTTRLTAFEQQSC